MSRLAVNQITTNRWSLEEDLQSYREEGFEAAGLWRPKFARFEDEERAIELVRESGLHDFESVLCRRIYRPQRIELF